MDFYDAQSGKAIGTVPSQLGFGFNGGSSFGKREGNVQARSVSQAYRTLYCQASGTDVDAGRHNFLTVYEQLDRDFHGHAEVALLLSCRVTRGHRGRVVVPVL